MPPYVMAAELACCSCCSLRSAISSWYGVRVRGRVGVGVRVRVRVGLRVGVGVRVRVRVRALRHQQCGCGDGGGVRVRVRVRVRAHLALRQVRHGQHVAVERLCERRAGHQLLSPVVGACVSG